MRKRTAAMTSTRKIIFNKLLFCYSSSVLQLISSGTELLFPDIFWYFIKIMNIIDYLNIIIFIYMIHIIRTLRISRRTNLSVRNSVIPHNISYTNHNMFSQKKINNDNQKPQQIQITNEQIAMMYKFMTDPNLSTPLPNPTTKDQETMDQYFKNPQQKISLSLLQLGAPEQFLTYFKQYANKHDKLTNQEYIELKLLILYQYCLVGGKISDVGGKLEHYAYLFMKELLLKENLEVLDERELQKFINLYQNTKTTCENLSLPQDPPLIRQAVQSTTLLKILSHHYSTPQSMLQILNHYRIPYNKDTQTFQNQYRISCWQFLNVHNHIIALLKRINSFILDPASKLSEKQSIQFMSKKINLQQHLQVICQAIQWQFRRHQDTNFQAQQFDEGEDQAVIKYSPIPFLELMIKSIPQICDKNSNIYKKIVEELLIKEKVLSKLNLDSLAPILYTSSVTLEQHINENKSNKQVIQSAQNIFKNILTLCLQHLKQKKKIKFNNYSLLWKTVMVVYKIKLLKQEQVYLLLEAIMPYTNQDNIRESIEQQQSYHQSLIEKQSQIFQMLVTYRILLPSTHAVNAVYTNILQEIDSNRPVLLKMMSQVRKIYERYWLANSLDARLVNNMIIVGMIGNEYSKTQINTSLTPITIYLTPPIKQALSQSQKSNKKHQKFISQLLNKYSLQI